MTYVGGIVVGSLADSLEAWIVHFLHPTEDEVGFIGSNAWLEYAFAEGSTTGRPRS